MRKKAKNVGKEPYKVDTPRGSFIGFREGGVLSFRGVPYARCKRFTVPERIENYGERQCMKSGPSSPQPVMFSLSGLVSLVTHGRGHLGDALPPGQSETECLNLQIYVPDDVTQRPYPVFVFIHGGAFIYGSNKDLLYQQAWGSKLAKRQGIAVVLVNYRLGCFGFCKVPGAASNLGVRDIVAALQFINEEGAHFGINPREVTVGGESAGGFLTGALLRAPTARGLFKRAFVMSGGTQNVLRPEDADIVGQHLARKVDIHNADSTKVMRAAFDMLGSKAFGPMPFQPVLDGEFLVDPPCAAGIDILAGVCENEALLFLPPLPMELALRNIRNSRDVAKVIAQYFDNMGCQTSDSDVTDVLSTARDDYPGNAKDAVRRLFSIMVFEAPLLATVDGLKDTNQVYTYRNLLGPCHAGELGYIFGNWNGSVMTRLVSGLPAQQNSDSERRGRAMEKLWGDVLRKFVVEGRPAENWPRYDDRGLALALGPYSQKEVALTTSTVALVRKWQAHALRPYGLRIRGPAPRAKL